MQVSAGTFYSTLEYKKHINYNINISKGGTNATVHYLLYLVLCWDESLCFKHDNLYVHITIQVTISHCDMTIAQYKNSPAIKIQHFKIRVLISKCLPSGSHIIVIIKNRIPVTRTFIYLFMCLLVYFLVCNWKRSEANSLDFLSS